VAFSFIEARRNRKVKKEKSGDVWDHWNTQFQISKKMKELRGRDRMVVVLQLHMQSYYFVTDVYNNYKYDGMERVFSHTTLWRMFIITINMMGWSESFLILLCDGCL
jgi:hypothetical protein